MRYMKDGKLKSLNRLYGGYLLQPAENRSHDSLNRLYGGYQRIKLGAGRVRSLNRLYGGYQRSAGA